MATLTRLREFGYAKCEAGRRMRDLVESSRNRRVSGPCAVNDIRGAARFFGIAYELRLHPRRQVFKFSFQLSALPRSYCRRPTVPQPHTNPRQPGLMEYQQSFDFPHLDLQGHHPSQHPQYQPQYHNSCPAEKDPEQGLHDIASKLGISLEDFLQQWAQITASGDNPFSFLTENLDINANESLYESAYNYGDAGSLCDPGYVSVDQQTIFDQDLCISPQALFVNAPQRALLRNHGGDGGMTARPEHVFAPVVSSNIAQHTTNLYSTTTPDIVPRPEAPLTIPIMYPILDPRKLALLRPGYYHLLSHDPVPTPQNMLGGSSAAAMRMIDDGVITMAQVRDVVLIVPRPSEYVGNPSMPAILFADLNRHGRPGPYVRDVLNSEAKLQGGNDCVLERNNWKTTPLRLNARWPGCITTSEVVSCTNQRGQPLTRTEFAHIVASKVVSLFQKATRMRDFHQTIDSNTAPCDLRQINPMKVRLIGVSYYRKLWVPILATNAKSNIWDDAVGPFPAVARLDRIFPPVSPPRSRPGMRDVFRP
ncbi:hypothetical protein D9619_012118 [Psilocybe cf. subviscida]|uniref:Uncharacterized protein n=1 Tax=Psilocybe cf. subviscida TaxID=2480587 RepID=A0A8H5EZK2_9AGAR|nr:hypothetical protein D9619_012118 [Psilocybe cf. subviscida]